MKLMKFLGWAAIGLVLLASLAYWFLPTIARIAITQGLTEQGFTHVGVQLDRPNLHAWTIPSLTFTTPAESGGTLIHIDNTRITYSFDSLRKNVVEKVIIERMKVKWDSSFLNRPTTPSPEQQTYSQFEFSSLGDEISLPVLPLQHLSIKHVEISNPLAPPTLQHISLNARLDTLREKYEGLVHVEGEELPLNLLKISLTRDGTVMLTGIHKDAPDDPVLTFKTSLDHSSTGLELQGETLIKLHPFIQTIASLYPLPPEYQSLSGTFSGSWTGTLPKAPSQGDTTLDLFKGELTLNAHMPTWPPFVEDIQLHTQASFSVEGSTVTLIVQPTSAGSANLSLSSLTPPALNPFISHKGLRSFRWNIQEPIRVSTPINSKLDVVEIPTGSVHITMQNASEQLDLLVAPHDLLWTSTGGIEGKGDVKISTHLKIAKTPSLSLDTLSLEAHAGIALSGNQVGVTLHPTTRLRLSNMKNQAMHIPAIESQFPKGLSWTYHRASQTWEMQTQTSTLRLPSFSLQGQQWKFGDIFTNNLRIQSTSQGLTVAGTTTIATVQPPITSFNIPPSDWQTRYSINPSSATVQINGQTQVFPLQVGGQIKLNRLTGQGSGTMTLHPIQFSPNTLIVSQLVQPWPFPEMDVTHGTVSASANVTFNAPTDDIERPFHINRLHGIVDFKEIGGFLKPTIMEGLTTRIEILGENGKLRIPVTPLRIKNIQSVVGLTHTALLFSTEPFHQTTLPTLSLTKFRTHLLGGMVSLSKTIIDPSATTHELTLDVQGLDLNDILRLEQQESIKGTGRLDGSLPFSISGKKISVQQGSIQARPPGGTLKFEVDKETAKAWARTQPQLDLVVKSLENYHYSKLEVGVDYAKNGILKLATTLEGKNPNFQNGVPIHFNLNIEENIPALIKSLSLVQGLEENIEKMMAERGKSLVQ